MKIVPLSPQHERLFWQLVHQDIVHYFFFALDWIHEKHKTQIHLALHNDHIIGMMLIYDHRIVHLRGQPQAVQAFAQMIDLDDVEIQTAPRYKHVILQYFTPTSLDETLIVMTLHKDHATPHEAYPVTHLHASDAPDIAAVMRNADPGFWGNVTDQRILQNMSNFHWIGIKRPRLVSVVSYRFTEWVGWISIVATMQTHRNQGYASTTISRAVTNLLEKHDQALIHVRADNAPAIHVYQKVGFTPYRSHFFIRGRRNA